MEEIEKIPVVVGIFAHNEEHNIARAIESVLKATVHHVVLKSVIVVSSGSLDKTNRIVRGMAKRDPRIQLIEEAERRGKSAAINLFLNRANCAVVATMSADLVLARKALEEIAVPFLNEEVGMVGAHPVPRGTRSLSIGEEVAILWELHHQVSLRQPKCGEFVAFRNIIRKIPPHSAVDEATIEVLLRLLGYSVVYAPLSIVYNKGPRNFGEFLTQRRRVQTGHQWVKTTYNYRVSTMSIANILEALVAIVLRHPSKILPLARLMGMELVAMGLGYFDYYVLEKNPYRWKMISR